MSRIRSKAKRRYNRLMRLAEKQKNENGEPICYWCKRVVVIVMAPAPAGFPEDFATLDHLVTRYDRPRRYMGMRQTVMACHRCNFDRGNEATAARGIDELRARSKRGIKSAGMQQHG